MSFADLIQEALFSTNNETRAVAERKLVDLTQTNTTMVLGESLQILANESMNPKIRVAAATLIKRAIIPDSEQGNTIWFNLDNEMKQNIKNILLQTLLAKDILIKKGTADVVATICAIELPRNEWKELIPLLAQNTNNGDIEIKTSAIITLGEICEKLKGVNFQLSDDIAENILLGICLGMNKDEENKEIKIAALNALDDSLAFMEGQFAKADYVQFVMDLLSAACSHQDIGIKKKAYQCLVDFCKIHYDKIGNYINDFFNLTANTMRDNSATDEIKILAIELWNTIAVEDKERREGLNDQGKMNLNQRRSFNYVSQVQFQLVPLLLRSLLVKVDSPDEEELSISATAFRALSSVCETVGDPVLENITNFIESMVSSKNSDERAASLKAFTCMLDGPSHERLKPLIMAALHTPVTMLFDEKNRVRESAAQCLSRIAEIHPDCLLNPTHSGKIIPEMLKGLTQKQSISQHICMAFNFLAEASSNFMSDPQFHSMWSLNVEKIIEALVQNAFRSDLGTNYQLIELSFLAVITIIYNMDSQTLAAKYHKHFIELFKNTVANSNERSQNLQACILAAMQICILKIGTNVTSQILKETYVLITEYFKHIRDVTSDGIYVVSALATSCGMDFSEYLQDFWQYLEHAMGKTNEPDTINAIFGAIQDISRATKEAFHQYMEQSLRFLDSCLNNSALSKELRLNVFICFGDIALAARGRMFPFLPDILKFFELAYEAGITLCQSNSPDSMDYFEQLKDKLIESMTCIVHALNDIKESEQILLPHFPKLFLFIKTTCDKNLNPTVEYLRNCLALEVDIIEFYQPHSRQLIDPDFLGGVITLLEKFQEIDQNRLIIEYAQGKLAKYFK